MRLHFTSDTTSLELGYDPLTPVDPDNKEMSPHSFDVTLGGEIIANGLATEQGLTRIESLPAGSKTLEIWLPQASAITIRSLAIEAGTTATIEPDPRPVWVAYGSSLTHCTRANSPACTWPALVARKYGLHLISLGFGGDCHLEPMVSAAAPFRLLSKRLKKQAAAQIGYHIRSLNADYISEPPYPLRSSLRQHDRAHPPPSNFAGLTRDCGF